MSLMIMDSLPNLEEDENYQAFLREVLGLELSDAALEDVQLRYIPDYIRELRIQKVYWGKEYRNWHDPIAQQNWKTYEKKLKDEINKQKTILKNIDRMRRLSVPNSKDKSHFSQSLDAERVQTLVTRIKENENDEAIVHVMMKDTDFEQTCYIIYAVCAIYGEFRMRPSRSNVRVNEGNELVLKKDA